MYKFLNPALFVITFLLPWQTRWIAGVEDIGGQSQFGVLGIFAVETLVLLTFIFLPRRKFAAEDRVSLMGLAGILTVLLVSTSLSIHPLISIYAALHVVIAGLYFLLILDRRVEVTYVLRAFALGLVIPAIFGVLQVATGVFPSSDVLGIAARDVQTLGESVRMVGEERVLRAYGSFSHPNVFGGYLAVGLVTTGYLFVCETRRSMKSLFLGLSVFYAFVLLLTFSQAAWIGLFLAIVVGVIAYKLRPVERARQVVIPVALGVIVLAFTGMFVLPGVLPQLEADSLTERVHQYKAFPAAVDGRWFTGVGPGAYPVALEEKYPGGNWWEYQPIHNVPLLGLAELGVFGLLAVLAWTSPLDHRNFSRFPKKAAVAAFMMGNIILVILFFDHYLWSSWAGLALVAYVLALTARLGEESTVF